MDLTNVRGSEACDIDWADEQSPTSYGNERRSRDSGWSSLSQREREVARLVAQGLKNADVARHLYLSRHTVDYHLRRVYTKLDLHSRVHLTRVVAERGDEAK